MSWTCQYCAGVGYHADWCPEIRGPQPPRPSISAAKLMDLWQAHSIIAPGTGNVMEYKGFVEALREAGCDVED